jgi:hypothetical protein
MRRLNMMIFSLAVLPGIFTFSIRPALAQDEKQVDTSADLRNSGLRFVSFVYCQSTVAPLVYQC